MMRQQTGVREHFSLRQYAVSDKGEGQGSVASPLLANIYLHYAFDLRAERWQRREATGNMTIVRYADDIIIGFEHEADARLFWGAMRERLLQFSLSADPCSRELAEAARNRLLQLSPTPDQLSGAACLPRPCDQPLATLAAAAGPTG